MTSRIGIAGVALAAAVAVFGAGRTASTAPQQDEMKGRHAEMAARQDGMAARHTEMMGRMAALDARISTLAQEVNSFKGEARINAMAALLTTMVEQHRTMRSAMTEMKGGMATMMESCPMHDTPDPSAGPAHDHNGTQK